MSQQIRVINSLGQEELFSERKVLRSLKRSGATGQIATKILEQIRSQLYQGINTSEIFKIVRQELAKEHPVAAVRFNLKQAIRNLGPDGFSFEKFIKRVFEKYGFSVKINQYIPGRCISYETDIVAEKEDIIYFGECKYRNQPGERIDLWVCMKLFAAASDVCPTYFKNKISNQQKVIPLVITNVKFTTQAIKYSKCQGIELLGWNYPKNNGLEKMIEDKKLYPITILPSFKKYMDQSFGEADLMLASDLLKFKDIKNISKIVGLSEKQMMSLVKEAEKLFSDTSIVKNR